MFISHIKIKDNNATKPLKFYDSSIKPSPYYSRLILVFGDNSLCFKPSEHRILTNSLTAYEGKNKYANGTILYASDFSFMPLRKHKKPSISLSVIYPNFNSKYLESSSYPCKVNNWVRTIGYFTK